MIARESDHIVVEGHVGTWYAIDSGVYELTPDVNGKPVTIRGYRIIQMSVREGTKMTKQLRDRILYYGSVDTRTYRYRLIDRQSATEQWQEIIRLPIAFLDTTAAIDGWETVEVLK